MEETRSPLSFSDRTVDKDKLHLLDDFGRTIDCHGMNSFIPGSVDRSQNGSLDIVPKVKDGK
ncbi:hypothetical protein Ancab_037481, partial [Ancistrocladus abbreviatus]